MSKRRAVLSKRLARIEYLRARAAYEREALSFHTGQLGHALSPKQWWSRLLQTSRFSPSGVRTDLASLIGQGFSLANQYPYVTATVSSLLVGKRWRWLKWLGVGFAAWQAVTASRTADLQGKGRPDEHSPN